MGKGPVGEGSVATGWIGTALLATVLVTASCSIGRGERPRLIEADAQAASGDAGVQRSSSDTGALAFGTETGERPASTTDPEVEIPTGVIAARVRGDTVAAYSRPDEESAVVATLDNPTDFGGPLVFQTVDPVYRPDREWIEVMLPVRPNGATGWVRTSEVELSRNPYRIEIDTGDHSLRVFRHQELWIETEVAIGTGITPTPIGNFYITELLEPPDPSGPYGPFAFGLSGFSETLTEFAGGDGVIGLHGTDEPESLGSDVSHGCVRLANDVVTELAGVLPLATPVRIRQ